LAPRRERAYALPVLALIEEKAGLLPRLDVDAKMQAMLDDLSARRFAVAAREAHSRLQPPERAHFRIGAFVNRLTAGLRGQRIQDRFAPELRARREELNNQNVGVAVHDQARQ